jgi:hypothetical protein
MEEGGGLSADRISLICDTQEGQWRFDSKNEVVMISGLVSDIEIAIFAEFVGVSIVIGSRMRGLYPFD